MTKSQVLSLVRHVLSGVAGVLIAKGVTDGAVTESVIGSVIALVSIVWSVFDKTFAVDKVEGVVRQVLTTLGLFVAFFKPDVVEQIIGFGTGILAIVLGQTDKTKSPQS